VVDASNGEALIGVNIYAPLPQIGTSTDKDGKFSLDLPQGDFSIRISYVGYATQTLSSDSIKDLTIKLMPQTDLEEVVVKAFIAKPNAPVSQKTLSAEEIEKVYVGQDPTYLLERTTPSIISYSENGSGFSNYSQFRLRGIDQTRVNITLNGVPINDMIDQGVFFSNFTDLANNIESVQIQRGAGTSTNGTASFAGSVNFESSSLYNTSPSAEAELVGGSFGTMRGSFGVNTGLLDNKWAFSSRFTTFKSDGYRNNTDSKSHSFYGSAGYFGEKNLLKFTGFIGNTQNGLSYSPVALSQIKEDPKTNPLNENDRDDFGQWMIQAQHTHLFNNRLSLANTIYYGGAGGDYFFTYEDTVGGFDQINYPLRNDHYGFMSNVNYSDQAGKTNLYGGIHVYSFQRQNREEFTPDLANPYYLEESFKNELSLFAKGDYTIGKFTIYGDLQFRTLTLNIDPDKTLLPDQENVELDWTFINPKIGLTYKIDDYKSIYASAGRNGREPTKVDLFGGFQLNSSNLVSIQNGDVKPEYVNDFELGLNFNYPWLAGQINGFYMQFENEIAAIGEFVPEGFLQLRKNMPSSYRAGVELDFTLKITDDLSFIGNSTYMRAQIDRYEPEGDQVYENVTSALSPEFMGSATLTYSFLKRISLRLGGRYVSESYLEPTNNEQFKTPEFFVADAGLSIRFSENSKLDLFVNNIFDELYFTNGAPVDNDFDGTFDEPGYFVQPPRNFYTKLTFEF
tara:strand:- start:1182 stop:3389 length:2208 start_codon:yes stop_codon:yes gene_type:complete